jgi:hypothetical protein
MQSWVQQLALYKTDLFNFSGLCALLSFLFGTRTARSPSGSRVPSAPTASAATSSSKSCRQVTFYNLVFLKYYVMNVRANIFKLYLSLKLLANNIIKLYIELAGQLGVARDFYCQLFLLTKLN